MTRQDCVVFSLGAALLFAVMVMVSPFSSGAAQGNSVSTSYKRMPSWFQGASNVTLSNSAGSVDVCQVTHLAFDPPIDGPAYQVLRTLTAMHAGRRGALGRALADRLDALALLPPMPKFKGDWGRQRDQAALKAAVAAKKHRQYRESASLRSLHAQSDRRTGTQQSRSFV